MEQVQQYIPQKQEYIPLKTWPSAVNLELERLFYLNFCLNESQMSENFNEDITVDLLLHSCTECTLECVRDLGMCLIR